MSEVLTIDPASVDECGIFRMPCSSNIRQERDCLGGNDNGAEVRHPQFQNALFRLQSFALWPAALHPRPQQLADAGFFYTGEGDRCVCFSCGNGLKDWEATDDPWLEHRTHFPNCPFVTKEISSGRLSSSNSSSNEPPISEALLCKVCYLKQMCVTFLPCKHVASCESCALCLNQCPICRQSIRSSLRVYL